jgi:hypothetical protein
MTLATAIVVKLSEMSANKDAIQKLQRKTTTGVSPPEIISVAGMVIKLSRTLRNSLGSLKRKWNITIGYIKLGVGI